MRALKILLILVLVIVAAVALLGLTGASTYRYERSAVVAAPVETVWEQVSTFSATDQWSPWNELDPNMTKRIEGTDGTVGATQRWKGNDQVGKGEQRIEQIEPNHLVRTRLKFIEPWSSESDVTVELQPEGEGTKVTWAMAGDNDFMGKLMSKFVDMDKLIGKDFEKGLGKLKQQAEAANAAQPKYDITLAERPSALYLGRRDTVAWAELKSAFEQGFGTGLNALAKAKQAPIGPPTAVYFAWNEEQQTADLIAAMPISATAGAKLKGQAVHEAPASKVLVLDHRGGYSGLGAAHKAMDKHMQKQGLQQGDVVLEEYITDPMAEPDSSKWLTRVVYYVK